MPDFQRLISASPITKADGTSVKVRILDDTTDKAEITNLNVKGFPTIVYRSSSGDISNYSGERTYEAITTYINNM